MYDIDVGNAIHTIDKLGLLYLGDLIFFSTKNGPVLLSCPVKNIRSSYSFVCGKNEDIVKCFQNGADFVFNIKTMCYEFTKRREWQTRWSMAKSVNKENHEVFQILIDTFSEYEDSLREYCKPKIIIE